MTSRKIISRILILIILLAFIRIFGCQTYKIDSFEMASSLYPNDRVIVRKFLTGYRLPASLFGTQVGKEKRLPALRRFKHDDIVLFNDPRLSDIPSNKRPSIISRIAGLPGDTVIILDKNLYINRKVVDPPNTVRRAYRIITDGTSLNNDLIQKYHVNEVESPGHSSIWEIIMDTTAYPEITSQENIKTVRKIIQRAGEASNRYWPFSSFFKWNRDQVGPLIVPYKGLTVDISLNTIDQYRNIIENHEDNELMIDYSGVRINGKRVESYTFKKDYYFVLDDNRDAPNDSRVIGFIPYDHLYGRITRILHSPVTGKLLKSVD